MLPIAPSTDLLHSLREIARSGFRYRETKTLARHVSWTLTDDEETLGYVAFSVPLNPESAEFRRLTVKIPEESLPVFALLTLFYFDENEDDPDEFDRAFDAVRKSLEQELGSAAVSGVYCYPHRAHWRYSYAAWSMTDALFVLVQDEMDIQFGMDLSLWVLPGGTELRVPLNYLYEPKRR